MQYRVPYKLIWLLLGLAPIVIPWSPDPTTDRQDLKCDSSCGGKRTEESRDRSYDKCCACRSQTTWSGNERDLYLEYISVSGKTLIIPKQPAVNGSVYQIVYKRKHLQFFPSNLCHWDADIRLNHIFKPYFDMQDTFYKSIVKIDLSYNQIHQLIDLNCLTLLDTLDLRNNAITAVSNTSIAHLTHLREFYLQNNQIKVMDPTFTSSPNLTLLNFNISNNQITKLDVTNMMSLYPFCELDYQGNKIDELVNELNMTPSQNYSNGPGMVTIKDNSIDTFPNFKKLLNLDKLSDLGEFLAFGFDLRDIPLNCDCNLQPFMSIANKNLTSAIWRSYFGVKCASPEALKGKLVVDISLDDLTCNRIDHLLCRQNCICREQPQLDTLFINCSRASLTTLPESFPESKYSGHISFDVSENSITRLTPESYMSKVSHLIMNDNDLYEIMEDAAEMLENTSLIDLSNNLRLHSIPKVLQHHNLCSIPMENIILDCNCDSSWIQNWVKYKTCGERPTFKCQVSNHGIILPEQFTSSLLECDEENYFLLTLSVILSSVIFLLVVTGVMSYWFRYEILICLLRTRQFYSQSTAITPVLTYDAYLSFDDDNDDLRKWVCFQLVPYLENVGYKLFVPIRDLQSGYVRDLDTIKSLSNSKTCLIILTASYLVQNDIGWMEQEWRYGWHLFKTCKEKQMVMINFDRLIPSEVSKAQMKAFLRVGVTIDFSNRKRDIMGQISKKLGPSRRLNQATAC